ncbi:MAG: rhomboid family intramembrane serine protease [Planctomycetes bacterium]|nr:rhomboid family intramembrane serine protease [Planctomycetota bacterium]
MFRCPRCTTPLQPLRKQGLCIWGCAECDGRLATVATLRRTLEPGFVHRTWSYAREHREPSARMCPGCRSAMRSSAPDGADSALRLDVCVACQFVWFDARELDGAPKKRVQPPPDSPQLSPAAREAAARFDVELQRERAGPLEPDGELPWRGLEGFGSPRAPLHDAARTTPWLTWFLAAACLVVTAGFHLLSDGPRDELLETFASGSTWRLLRGGSAIFGYTLVDGAFSFALHLSIVALVVNVGALLAFLPAVEEALGRVRLLFLIYVASLAGLFVEALAGVDPTFGPVGAGAGLAGALAWYALAYPHVRLSFGVGGANLASSARVVFAVFVALQVVLGFALRDPSLALAPIGGVVVGLAWWGVPRLAGLHGVPLGAD